MLAYQKTSNEILTAFSVDPQKGLTPEQVTESRLRYGENRLPEEKRTPYWKIFLKSFKEPIVIVLLGAVCLSLVSSFYTTYVQMDAKHGIEALYEAIAILILIVLNALLGCWQEISAQNNLTALKKMNQRMTTVMRSGHWQTIVAQDLVVGDIVRVAIGDFIEADVRWIEINELQVVEAHLTGEADTVSKQVSIISEIVELGDRTNMGYSGSSVTNGQGLGVVIGVGQQTELGTIAKLIQSVKTKK